MAPAPAIVAALWKAIKKQGAYHALTSRRKQQVARDVVRTANQIRRAHRDIRDAREGDLPRVLARRAIRLSLPGGATIGPFTEEDFR